MGRSSIVYVIGLSVIVGLVLRIVTNNSASSMDVFIDYYGTSQARNIATSAANIGSSYILSYPVFPSNFGVTFFNGHDTVIYLANTPQPFWITLRSMSSTINLDANGHPYRDTIDAVFKHVQFAKYSWFTESETNGYFGPDGSPGPYNGVDDWKITGDSVFGPAHTNGNFNLDGTPYFDTKATAGGGLNLGPSAVLSQIFQAGYELHVHQNRPSLSNLQTNLTNAAMAGGVLFDETVGSNDVALTFLTNRVRVQIPAGGGGEDTTMYLNALSTNGVIVVKNADLHIKGTYEGGLTVAAFGGTGAATNKGNVWIDGDLLAQTSPLTNPASDDMLGIVAGRMAYITQDLTRTPSTVINIQATVYCQNGELTAQNFWSLPVSGRVNLFGGVTQYTAGSLGLSAGGPPLSMISGFLYSIRNDPRFLTKQPPYFPYSDSYELVSWWE